MRKRTASIAFAALAVLTLLAIEWPVTQPDLPVTLPAPSPPPTAAISPEKPAPQAVPTAAPPAPPAAQPDPLPADQQGTSDSPGDPLAQPENPTEQFMHSRRGDGQHSE